MPLKNILILLSALMAPAAFADALCSHGVGGFATGVAPSNGLFEKNRAAFKARGTAGKRVKYCVMVDGQPKKISAYRLRAYKRATVEELVAALVDCDAPKTLALTQVKPKKRAQVLGYFAQEYRLRLTPPATPTLLAKRSSSHLDAAIARADSD